MFRNRWLWLGIAPIVLATGSIAAVLDPNRIVPGLLAGDTFYRHRPTRYWRERLRESGKKGQIEQETRKRLGFSGDAVPILLECAGDPDVNVRWPALGLLALTGARTERVLDTFVNALHDEEPEVRLKAINGLASWGTAARAAIPALVERLNDRELQVSFEADRALWQIDVAAAVEAAGWKSFTSDLCGFTAIMPSQPERSVEPVPVGPGVIHRFAGVHNVCRYDVNVFEYPSVFVAAIQQARFEAEHETSLAAMGGKLVREDRIEQHGWKGNEYLIEVEGLGQFRQRAFWVGRRRYTVLAAFNTQFLNANAAQFFLDSFRLDRAHSEAERQDGERSSNGT
jgi:hypothetical protein